MRRIFHILGYAEDDPRRRRRSVEAARRSADHENQQWHEFFERIGMAEIAVIILCGWKRRCHVIE